MNTKKNFIVKAATDDCLDLEAMVMLEDLEVSYLLLTKYPCMHLGAHYTENLQIICIHQSKFIPKSHDDNCKVIIIC